MATGPLFDGIPALGPKDRREFFWGQFQYLHAILGARTVKVTTRFQSDPLLGFGNMNDHDVESVLEVQSFFDSDAVDPDGARQSARELKRIADLLEERFRDD
jgi:hypothetical protein